MTTQVDSTREVWRPPVKKALRTRARRTAAGGAVSTTPPAVRDPYPAGAGADGSFCQRPNSFPWMSLQVTNHPILGTGAGSTRHRSRLVRLAAELLHACRAGVDVIDVEVGARPALAWLHARDRAAHLVGVPGHEVL